MYQSFEIDSSVRILPENGEETPLVSARPKLRQRKMIAVVLMLFCVMFLAMYQVAQPKQTARGQVRVMKARQNQLTRKIARPSNLVHHISQDQTRPTVTCGSTVSGSVTNAQVFYTLVAPDITLGTVTISTCGSSLDTYLYVYQGTSTTNAMWECDDCGTCGFQTAQTFSLSGPTTPTLTRSQTYTIGVGAYGGGSGAFTMRITCNMQCGSVGKGTIAANKRIPINFQVPPTGTVTMSTCQSNFNTFLYVYSGNSLSYSCNDCGTCPSGKTKQQFVVGSGSAVSGGTGTNGLTAGTTVRIEVGGSGSAAGNVELSVTCAQGTTVSPSKSPTRNPVRPGATTPRPTRAPFAPIQSPAPGCPRIRVRKDWHDLSQGERNLYLSGYKALRTSGRLAIFQEEHEEAGWEGADNLGFHGNAQFLPWHRYFIWELEEQIRALGGSYSCFTLPYWDWTRTSGQLVASNPMFSQGLGGNGTGPNSCVQDGELRQGVYQTTAGTCLQREFTADTSLYNDVQDSMMLVETVQTYDQFRNDLEGNHDNAHVSIGGTLGIVDTATDDPIFFMLHAYVDMLWAMRSDCHNYGNEETERNYPIPNHRMSYPVLSQHSWASANGRTFSAQAFLRTEDLWFTYDASDMKSRSGMNMTICSWNSIQHRPLPREQEIADKTLTAADMVNKEIREEKAQGSMTTDEEIAKKACLKMQQREVDQGLRKEICRYKEPLEKCAAGPGPLKISLEALLDRRGVRDNPCINQVRRQNYNFAKRMGTLRGLCNGASDLVC